MTNYRKKLIEVALPLNAINEGSKPETENPFLKGHPRAIHNWWARTPLSVSRAILFAQMIDDPSNDLPEEKARIRREELFDIVRHLATWEAISDDEVLEQARKMIRDVCGGETPEFWDMFSGRASIPLEAQRLGFKVTSSDLNPVAVVIEKALIEIPPRFTGCPPVNPDTRSKIGGADGWNGSAALAEDISFYGKWMRDELERRIGDLYPQANLSSEHGGGQAHVSTWLWTRTVTSLDPAAAGTQVPLVRSFALSRKKEHRTWIEPVIDRQTMTYSFKIRTGEGKVPKGTVSRSGGRCLLTNSPIPFEHIRAEGKARRIGSRLMAMAVVTEKGQLFLPPSSKDEAAAYATSPSWVPDGEISHWPGRTNVVEYGMTNFADLFSARQLTALTTLISLIAEARERIVQDALDAGMSDDSVPLYRQGSGAQAYADAIATFLACAVSRYTDYSNALCTWNPTNENIRNLFQRQAIPMAWDYSEVNPLHGKLSFSSAVSWVLDSLTSLPAGQTPGRVLQVDARKGHVEFSTPPIVSTDPPYYDNISYAVLADFFYVWLRESLKDIYPDLFTTLLTPKEAELIASPYFHKGSKEAAKQHFRDGFKQTSDLLRDVSHSDFPVTIYYAFKQKEELVGKSGRGPTGWETMLEGLMSSEFQITGTLPVRTTKKARAIARDSNALASAIVLVCRPRPTDAPMATRRDFINALRHELPAALKELQQGNIAPVDLAQASIGPGMAVFSRYQKVVEADGSSMRVRTALALINQALDEYLNAQEGEYDPDTRWALAWFEQYAFNDGPYGDAETLSKAKNTSVGGMVQAGIVQAGGGKVRLLQRKELPAGWNPSEDTRLTVWEVTQQLIRAMQDEGEEAAAELLARVGPLGDAARDLAYRLYTISERKGWAQEALPYNALVVAWSEVGRMASEKLKEMPERPLQPGLGI